MIPNARLYSPEAAIAEPQSGLDSLRQQISFPQVASKPARSDVNPDPKEPVTEPSKKIESESVPKPVVEPKDEPAKPDTTAKTKEITDPEIKELTKDYSNSAKTRLVELANKYGVKMADEKIKSVEEARTKAEAKAAAAEKKNAELLAELRQYGIERSPEFMQKFVERPKEIRSRLETIAKDYEVPLTDLNQAIENGDRKKLNELVESVGVIDRNEMAQLILEGQKIERDRTQIKQDAESALKVIQEKRQGETKAYVEKLLASRKASLEKEVLPIIDQECSAVKLFEGEEGQAIRKELTSAVDRLNSSDLERMSPKDRAAMIYSALVSKPLYLAHQKSLARITELEELLAKYDASSPKVGGSTTQKTPDEKPKTFIERARAGEL